MKPIKSIIIVGGGTAGWMSACYLNQMLPDNVTVTLVESPDIATVGVGEATVPTIAEFFAKLNIPEQQLFTEADASIKSAIKFVDWYKKGQSYYHPFEAPYFSDGIEACHHWAALAHQGFETDSFAHDTGVLASLCDNNKVSKKPGEAQYQAATLYAYHLDAVKLAALLRKISMQRGVRRIEDTVTSVQLNEQGEIGALGTEHTGELTADFYVDCSGFRGLLIEQALGASFHSYADELWCDRAVAIQTPHADEANILPYTTATAVDNGWIWEIGLSTRRGNGYVYSSHFTSPEEAEQTLRDHLGCGNEPMAKHLRMRVGRREHFWQANCLAVGLSAGFIEPLESTGLQFIQVGLEQFVEYFPGAGDYGPLQQQYNQVMSAKYDDVKDFIVAHYCLTKRDDSPFWQHMQHKLPLSSGLKHKLALWQHKLPSHSDLNEIGMFGAPNYMYILAGMGHLLHPHQAREKSMSAQRADKVMRRLKQLRHGAIQSLPSHLELLRSYRRKGD